MSVTPFQEDVVHKSEEYTPCSEGERLLKKGLGNVASEIPVDKLDEDGELVEKEICVIRTILGYLCRESNRRAAGDRRPTGPMHLW